MLGPSPARLSDQSVGHSWYNVRAGKGSRAAGLSSLAALGFTAVCCALTVLERTASLSHENAARLPNAVTLEAVLMLLQSCFS